MRAEEAGFGESSSVALFAAPPRTRRALFAAPPRTRRAPFAVPPPKIGRSLFAASPRIGRSLFAASPRIGRAPPGPRIRRELEASRSPAPRFIGNRHTPTGTDGLGVVQPTRRRGAHEERRTLHPSRRPAPRLRQPRPSFFPRLRHPAQRCSPRGDIVAARPFGLVDRSCRCGVLGWKPLGRDGVVGRPFGHGRVVVRRALGHDGVAGQRPLGHDGVVVRLARRRRSHRRRRRRDRGASADSYAARLVDASVGATHGRVRRRAAAWPRTRIIPCPR